MYSKLFMFDLTITWFLFVFAGSSVCVFIYSLQLTDHIPYLFHCGEPTLFALFSPPGGAF